jgi:2,3,4,5-tetrahydropyridine-2-carboxylate N-succinyltransferase
MTNLENIINSAFENRADITPANASAEIRDAVKQTLNLLDSGKLRVAEKINGEWVTHQWLKKAVLLSFRINDNRLMDGGNTRY